MLDFSAMVEGCGREANKVLISEARNFNCMFLFVTLVCITWLLIGRDVK